MSTHSIPQSTAQGIGLVGQVVTFCGEQYKVHSVGGRDWQAFEEGSHVSVDFGLPAADWIVVPVALIIPSGHRVGEGFGREVPVTHLRRGVCLDK